MCDPISIISSVVGLAGSIFGGKKKKGPPAPALPAPRLADARTETGAEVLLGGERETDKKKKLTDLEASRTTTSGSGLKVGKGRSGLNIL